MYNNYQSWILMPIMKSKHDNVAQLPRSHEYNTCDHDSQSTSCHNKTQWWCKSLRILKAVVKQSNTLKWLLFTGHFLYPVISLHPAGTERTPFPQQDTLVSWLQSGDILHEAGMLPKHASKGPMNVCTGHIFWNRFEVILQKIRSITS